ncbi:MAG: hypothetical protein ACPIOQ_77815, partial [Promethearchaeia archaeon]
MSPLCAGLLLSPSSSFGARQAGVLYAAFQSFPPRKIFPRRAIQARADQEPAMADAAGKSSDGGQHVRPGTAMSGASRPHSAAHGGGSSEDPARAHALPVHAVEERPRPSSSLMSTSLPHAYIHDAFESLHGSGGAPVGRSAHRRLPDHLLFDVSKTQLVKRGPRARVATPAEPVRGFKNQAEATKLPA